jgi:hypothetical protein
LMSAFLMLVAGSNVVQLLNIRAEINVINGISCFGIMSITLFLN